MKERLLLLAGILLFAATLKSASADPLLPLQTEQGQELHSVVTDMPDIIDMSHADPKRGIVCRQPFRSTTILIFRWPSKKWSF
jgi:hypothetical protein